MMMNLGHQKCLGQSKQLDPEREKKPKTLLIWDPWLRGKARAENKVYLWGKKVLNVKNVGFFVDVKVIEERSEN